MALEWKYSTEEVDWDELSAMYRAAPLGGRASSLKTVFTNSLFKCFVYEQGHLVGAGGTLADGADWLLHLHDIAVLPGHQGTGLGKQIMSYLLRSRDHRKIILYAVPGREPFYRKFGFMRMRTAMAIFENQQQQIERGYLSES